MLAPLFGMNRTIHEVGFTADGFRGFNPPPAGLPQRWPVQEYPSYIRHPFLSFRPDPKAVADGKLDSQLTSFAATVPAGAMVTLWHEGEAKRFGFDPDMIRLMHMRARLAFWEGNPGVRYGQVVESYSARHNANFTEFIAPGMDFYGIDAYPETREDDIESTARPALDKLPGDSFIGISEFNPRGAHGSLMTSGQAWMDAWSWSKLNGLSFFFAFELDTPAFTQEEHQALEVIAFDSEHGF